MWIDSRTLSRLTTQVAAMNRKLDLILANLGIEYAEPVHAVVAEHIAAGNKIAAIKAYREQTGVGLAEAKREVEALARTLGTPI